MGLTHARDVSSSSSDRGSMGGDATCSHLERCMWWSVFAAAAAFTCWQVSGVVRDYLRFEVDTSLVVAHRDAVGVRRSCTCHTCPSGKPSPPGGKFCTTDLPQARFCCLRQQNLAFSAAPSPLPPG